MLVSLDAFSDSEVALSLEAGEPNLYWMEKGNTLKISANF